MDRQQQPLEQLETRRLLAASAVLSSRGVFIVTGSEAADSISVALSSDGTKVQATDTATNTLIGEADLASVKSMRIYSGGGDDSVTVDSTITFRVSIDAGAGNDTLVVNSTGSNSVFAGDGNDTVTAGAGNNHIDGGAGDDSISGGSAGTGKLWATGGDGNDTLTSDAATSYLLGQAGDDTITGGTGNDTIYGGDGTDSLSGGSGGTDSVNEDNPTFNRDGHGRSHGGGECGQKSSSDDSDSSSSSSSTSTTSVASVKSSFSAASIQLFSRRRIH